MGPRGQLVTDLVSTLLPAYGNVAEGKAEALVALDEGLSLVTRHASGLGYDAVILVPRRADPLAGDARGRLAVPPDRGAEAGQARRARPPAPRPGGQLRGPPARPPRTGRRQPQRGRGAELRRQITETLRREEKAAAKLLANTPIVVKPINPGTTSPETRDLVSDPSSDVGGGDGLDREQLALELEGLQHTVDAEPTLRVAIRWTLRRIEGGG